MKALFKFFVLILFVLTSCQSQEDWYLGEWTNDETTFTLTKKEYSNPSWGQTCPVKIRKTSTGDVFIDLLIDKAEENWDYTISANNDSKVLSLVFDNFEIPFDKVIKEDAQPSSNAKVAQAEKTSKSTNLDKQWKSAFDSNGYLVLKSEVQYHKLPNTTSYYYVILKGYGANYKRGKVTVRFGTFIENVGIYDYDDGVLIFPEFYTATGYPADDTAVEGRIFNVEFSPTISITEFKEPYRGQHTIIKYSQTNSRDFNYEFSSNPHPRFR